MSFTLDADTKERVRAATDIVDLVSSCIELRRQGRNYVALCPFHRDRRPSLQVNPERQIWKCWVCDIGGDVFNFVMQFEGISFPDALRMLAERAGIELPAPGGPKRKNFGSAFSSSTMGSSTMGGPTMGGPNAGENPSSQSFSQNSVGSADDKQTLYRVMAWASRLYHQYLLKHELAQVARDYLTERGITAESIEKFEIGLAPDGWSYLTDQVMSAGYSPRHLEATGLVARGEKGNIYDRFRNRVMFPIRDTQKRIIAFGGRILPGASEGAKYINSPESRIFTKNQHLYGLDAARDTIRAERQAIVMEGYTDVIVAHQCGLSSAVAVLGTALGANHLKLLRHLCDQVILLLDGDEAGQKRSDEVLELFLNAQMDVRVLTLPDGLDPADYLLKENAESLMALTRSAPDALEFKMRRVCDGFDPIHDTHRANQAIEQMLTLLSKVPRSTLINNDQFLIRRNQILTRLSRRFAVQEDDLRNRLRSLSDQASRTRRVEDGTSTSIPGRPNIPAHQQTIGDQHTGSSARAAGKPMSIDQFQRADAGKTTRVRNNENSGYAQEPIATNQTSSYPEGRLARPGDLSPIERELLELLVSTSQLAPMILERVQPEWLESDAARQMLDIYHQLELEAYSLEFDSVLVAIEDPSLKSLMVTLYEQAQAKQQYVKDTPEQRLRVLTQRMGQHKEEQQRRRQLLQFEDGGLDDETELNLLTDFIRQARQSHGLSIEEVHDSSTQELIPGETSQDNSPTEDNQMGSTHIS